MRRFLFLLTAAALLVPVGGCTSASGSLIPIKAVGSAVGDMTGPQVFINSVPVNALVKVHGQITYTVQPFPPYLTYDGDYTIIVEPLPGREAEAIAAVQRGDILIRRGGQPSALNAPGTIAAFKAARAAPRVSQPPKPPAVPPVACVGGSCSLPR